MKWTAIIAAIVIFVLLLLSGSMVKTVPAGQVGVGSVFGKVQETPYDEGLHIVNPFVRMTLFDAKQKTHKESMRVPSRDQLLTQFDLSIQYRLIKESAPKMLKETGKPNEVLEVHMIPLLRSQVREIGKSVEKAEDFYQQKVQQRIQSELLEGLSAKLAEKGIKIEQLLIRDVVLPEIITRAVTRKKEAAQAAEKAKEELKKFKVDQERKEAQAEAEKKAELIQADKQKQVLLIAANAKLEAAKIDAEKQKQVLLIKAQAELEAAKIDAEKQKQVLLIAANAKREAAEIEAQSVLIKAEAEAEAKKKIISALSLEGFIKLESMQSLEKMQKGNHMIIMDPNNTNPLPFLNLNKTAK